MKRLQLYYDVPTFTLTADVRLELVHDWKISYRGERYLISSGFVTDGASIPAWLQWLCGSPWKIPRFYAALVHDYLYSGGDPEATRADADDLFRDLQIALGIPRWKAYVEWAALRIFGWTHWQGNNQPYAGEIKHGK